MDNNTYHTFTFEVYRDLLVNATKTAKQNESHNKQSINDILRTTPIEALGKYQPRFRKTNNCTDEHKMATLRGIGIETLYDWQNKDLSKVTKPGFSAKRYIGLQNEFRNMVQDKNFCQDLRFWAPRSLPSNYDVGKTLFENIDNVLNELLEFVQGCTQRKAQIPNNRDVNRISCLCSILDKHYKKGVSLDDIRQELNLDSIERARQLIKNELLTPLFNGMQAVGDVLGNISINSTLLEQINMYNGVFSCTDTPIASSFVKDVLKIDYVYIDYANCHIVVPAETTGCYNIVLQNVMDELIEIIIPTQVDELLERVGQNDNIQKKILQKNKEYSNDFIYALLEKTDLVTVSEEDGSIIINPSYIRHSKGCGNIIKEKALARIIADAKRQIREDEIIKEYYSRYQVTLKKINLSSTTKYNISAIGKSRTWEYVVNEARQSLREWVGKYAQEQEIFYFEDICKALQDANYSFNQRSLRTYITNCCQVDNDDVSHFCHTDCINNYPQFRWREPVNHGVVNWLANELRVLFEDRQVDSIHISDVNSYLYERGQGTEYAVDVKYGYTTLISSTAITASPDSPFTIDRVARGDWALKKNGDAFNSTIWTTIGTRGKEWEQKLLALATNMVRKTDLNRMILTDLARDIVENEEVEGLNEQQVRRKLMNAIKSTNPSYPLTLTRIDGRLYVSVDAKRIVKASRYESENNKQITYQTVSQLTRFNWDDLCGVMKDDLRACSKAWYANGLDFDEAFDCLVGIIQVSNNRNLNTIFPQRLYEFYFVGNPTDDDRYCIMCSIAKNFEGLLSELYYQLHGQRLSGCHGLWELTSRSGLDEFNNVLDRNVPIDKLKGWKYALKSLSFVRNTDAHGEWYVDKNRFDSRHESEKNIEKIRHFAALYVFAVANYMQPRPAGAM